MSTATTAATRATLASERAASAKRALEDALAYALEQGCEVEWTDTREELEGEDLLAPLPLGYSIGEQWQYGAGLDAILPPDLRDRDPLPGTPLALARRSFARNTPTYRWVVTRCLILSEPMARLARRSPATVRRTAEAARECVRRLNADPHVAAVAAFDSPQRRSEIRYAEVWLNITVQQAS